MKDDKEFSWSALFSVTACCSFVFNGPIKLMDGSFSNLLFQVGGIAAFLAVINWAARTMASQPSKKRKDRRFAP